MSFGVPHSEEDRTSVEWRMQGEQLPQKVLDVIREMHEEYLRNPEVPARTLTPMEIENVLRFVPFMDITDVETAVIVRNKLRSRVRLALQNLEPQCWGGQWFYDLDEIFEDINWYHLDDIRGVNQHPVVVHGEEF